jgi:hypothetical protein
MHSTTYHVAPWLWGTKMRSEDESAISYAALHMSAQGPIASF